MSSGLPAHIEEGGPRLLRPPGPDRRPGAVRPVAQHQVRDLRHLAHQGLHHRRAARAGLGAALGAQLGARGRGERHPAREPAARGRRPTTRSPPSWASASTSSRTSSTRSAAPPSSPWTSSGTSTGPGQDKVNLIDTIEDSDAPDPSRAYRVQVDQGDPGGGHRAAARAGEDRHRALLLRGSDPEGDRRGPGRDRVAGLAAPHQGDPSPQGPHQGRAGSRRARRVGRCRPRSLR